MRLRKNVRGMSLVSVMVAVAISGVIAMTVTTLVDYMSRSTTRLAVMEAIGATERGVLLCVQRPGAECGNCFYNAAPPDNTKLTIAALPAGALTQNVGSIRTGTAPGVPLVVRTQTLPGEARVTVQDLQFVEDDPARRAASTIGGLAYTTLYGNLAITFAGPARILGGNAIKTRNIPVSISRQDATGIVDQCGMGTTAANVVCTTATATQPTCPGTCSAPHSLQAFVVAFDTQGKPICGCYCIPNPASALQGPPGPAGAAGPAGPAGPAAIK